VGNEHAKRLPISAAGITEQTGGMDVEPVDTAG